MTPDAGTPKAKKSTRAKAPKTKTAERVKCSLLLTRENDLRLTVLASLKGKGHDRSSLLNSILDEALRGVVVSLRGQLATEQGAGEGTEPEADAEAA